VSAHSAMVANRGCKEARKHFVLCNDAEFFSSSFLNIQENYTYFVMDDLTSKLSLKRWTSPLPASTLVLRGKLTPTLTERHF